MRNSVSSRLRIFTWLLSAMRIHTGVTQTELETVRALFASSPHRGRAINETRFWKIIDTAWQSSDETRSYQKQIIRSLESEEAKEAVESQYGEFPDEVVDSIRSQLDVLSAEDLLTFDRILERKHYYIDWEEIHEYTDGSDDGFLYCRGFIVAMGQAFYDTVNADPSKALCDFECEVICYISSHLYEYKFGELPESDICRETGSNDEGW